VTKYNGIDIAIVTSVTKVESTLSSAADAKEAMPEYH